MSIDRTRVEPSPLAPPHGIDRAKVRHAVERIAAERWGISDAADCMTARGWGDGSSHPSAIVTLRPEADRGQRIDLFVKDFGSARFATREPKQDAWREVRVYRDLLAEMHLGTAEHYGGAGEEDDPDAPYCLVLELVPGTALAYRGYEPWWTAAARWLARLHTRVDRDRIAACPFLLWHDREFFWSTARRAVVAVSAMSHAAGERLTEMLRGYEPCVSLLSAQPATLVHGSFKPHHVLVDDADPRRVCPVDWELAARGSRWYDLGFLAYGVRDEILDRLLDAYDAEGAAEGLAAGQRQAARACIDCVRAHRALKSLARAQERGMAEDRIVKRVASAERHARSAWSVPGGVA